MNEMMEFLTVKDLRSIGFKDAKHMVIKTPMLYDLGRNRFIHAGNIGGPSEMFYLCQIDGEKITDLICIHNFDYDGAMTKSKIDAILACLSSNKK